MNSEEAKNNFFILNEKDGTYSAYGVGLVAIKTKKMQFVIDAILVELGDDETHSANKPNLPLMQIYQKNYRI